MFYSQVILAKKGPLAKVWLAAHWGDKKLARPQIFATDISQSCTDIMNPSVPLALRLSGHLLLGVVRIYSRKVKYVLNDCTEAMLKLQMAFQPINAMNNNNNANANNAMNNNNATMMQSTKGGNEPQLDAHGNPIPGRELLSDRDAPSHQLVTNFGEYDQVHVVEGFCLPLPEDNEWILAEDQHTNNTNLTMEMHMMNMTMGSVDGSGSGSGSASQQQQQQQHYNSRQQLAAHPPTNNNNNTSANNNNANNNNNATTNLSGSPGDEEEEAWAPFDPDDDEEEDDDDNNNNNNPNDSRVSDIEVVRAANDSLLSDDQTRRASSLLDKSNLTTDDTDPTNANATANNDAQDGDDYDFNVPFGDDEEEESADGRGGLAAAAAAASAPLDDSALQLSRDGGTPLSKTGNADALLGLSMDDASPQQQTQHELQMQLQLQPPSAATTKPKKRRKRRRKVVIDNHETELTNDHIRGMLKDTDDIVIPMIHPASLWDEDDTGKDYRTLVRERRARDEGTNSNTNTNTRSNKRRKKTVGFADGGAASISFSFSSSKGAGSHAAVPSLTRPFLEDAADRGGPALHPLLKGLWEENYWKALGKPCPYKRRSNKSDNHNDNDDEATADDVERVRRGAGHADDESTLASQRLDEFNEAGYGLDFDDREHEQRSVVSTGGPQKQTTGDDDVDFPATMDDDDDEEEDVDAPVPDFGDEEDDEEHLTAVAAERAGDDPLDLGMVNDMVLDSDPERDLDDDDENDDDDNDRQAIGDVASSSTKWHKHTIRVFSHLKKCLRDSNNNNSNADADTDADLPDTVRFRELTRNVVSRRNASSVFFEMLQLKTWDFIELEQEESYGDIFISPGLRFGEEAPVN